MRENATDETSAPDAVADGATGRAEAARTTQATRGISFELTDEQRELQAVAHEFAERELRSIARDWDEREDYPPRLLAKAAAAGLTSYAIPEEFGGGGVDAVTAALIAEELSWGCAGLASTIQATMFPVRPLLRFGTDEQRRRYLPLLAREEGALGAIAFTEAHAGSDLASIRASARRDGDAWILGGEKVYVTNGGIADLTVVFACAEEGITAFLVERGDPGVAAGRKERKLGLRASYTGSLVLDGARLPADRLLGEPGEGFLVAMDFFEVSRPQVAAAAVGVARAAFEHATEYARTREAFGRPILDRQGVSFKLADMAMQIEAARLLVWRACAASDAGRDAGLLGSYAKAFAADAAMRATTDAVQILGGAGIMRDHPVEKWLRDAKVFQVVEGTSEIQRQIVATYLQHGWSERPK
jgi:alkylation response protein AidB-like acyl-CoA dehydrogenase